MQLQFISRYSFRLLSTDSSHRYFLAIIFYNANYCHEHSASDAAARDIAQNRAHIHVSATGRRGENERLANERKLRR